MDDIKGEDMDWTQALTIIASILIPMLAGFGWLINKINDVEKRLSHEIGVVDQRLSRLEGAFEERGKWESKGKGTGT